jgi:Putative zinc-finger
MTAERCRDFRALLGARVLGRLDAAERAALEAHLETCSACRAEAEALDPLSRLLALADPSRIESVPAPPPELAPRVLAAVASERRAGRRRRRRRLGLALAGAATAAAAAVIAIVALTGGEEGSIDARPGPQRISFGQLPPGAAIAAKVSPGPSGTEIRIGVRGLGDGTLCRVFLRRRDGTRVPAGSFRYSSEPGADAVLTSGLELSQVSALVLVAGRWTYTARLRG